ncbi:hypothetical protein EDB89DRAFT_1978538 [Lactarius sanguifluus]|nr:hypothetical protein EDB89DRAFT_2037047 [Lactarius sanguifluus]KAH9170355.1 hypothetical protein EDB89DRAFT_1978538 [Lactarius sanguifluus]
MAYWSPLYTNKPRPVGILALSDELLGKIIDDTELSEHDVLNLRCVNSIFRDLATRRAFWEVVVHTTDESTLGFLEFLVTPDIAEYVRDIKIVEDLGPVPHNFETERDEDERYKRVGNRLRTACFMLHLIPDLQSITLAFLPDKCSLTNPFAYGVNLSRYQLLQLNILEGLAYNPNPLPTLQSLHIHSWFAFRHELYATAPFQAIVASLQDLCFLVQDTEFKGEADHGPAVDLLKDVIELRVLRPAVNLTSLAMRSSVEFGWLFRLDLNSITFPSLTELSLTDFVWDDGTVDPEGAIPGVEGFILCHGKTLKRLELRGCTICVPHDRSTPVRSWAAVWNRFAEELTELVILEVVYNQLRYVYFRQHHGFDKTSSVLLHGTEEDTPALEALLTIVSGRQLSNPSQTEKSWWCDLEEIAHTHSS